jgi:hypothetical protein
VTEYSRQVIPRLIPALSALTERVAAVVRDSVVDVMRSGTPSGFTDDAQYTSSAPGEPPAFGRGVYAGSWHTTPGREEGKTVVAEAFSAMRDRRTGRLVADALEHGDEDAAPRPHIRPGLHNSIPAARDLVEGTRR